MHEGSVVTNRDGKFVEVFRDPESGETAETALAVLMGMCDAHKKPLGYIDMGDGHSMVVVSDPGCSCCLPGEGTFDCVLCGAPVTEYIALSLFHALGSFRRTFAFCSEACCNTWYDRVCESTG